MSALKTCPPCVSLTGTCWAFPFDITPCSCQEWGQQQPWPHDQQSATRPGHISSCQLAGHGRMFLLLGARSHCLQGDGRCRELRAARRRGGGGSGVEEPWRVCLQHWHCLACFEPGRSCFSDRVFGCNLEMSRVQRQMYRWLLSITLPSEGIAYASCAKKSYDS